MVLPNALDVGFSRIFRSEQQDWITGKPSSKEHQQDNYYNDRKALNEPTEDISLQLGRLT